MCGRYSVVIDEAKLRKQFSRELTEGSVLQQSETYNMAPTQYGPVITDKQPDRLSSFRWGLVPFWAKDLGIGARMINARSESIAEKPSFRKAIRERRCLVIADSFYEWKREGGKKQPYRILPSDDGLLVMAGIWERWQPKDDPEADPVYTYSIITGEPNAEMDPIHNRMPMLLQREEQQSNWLSDDLPLPQVLELLQTPPDGTLRHYPVSPAVGNVRNNGPDLHLPL